MIVVITSTIFPEAIAAKNAYQNTITGEQRLKQTINTIASLKKLGLNKIHLFDNSYNPLDEETIKRLSPAIVSTFNMFQFENKGLTELYLLIAGLKNIPTNIPILKISGRYELEKITELNLNDYEFIGKYCKKSATISTRNYYFKNKCIYEKVLLYALNYIYAYQYRIVGPRSSLKIIRNAIKPNLDQKYYAPTISIERGMGEAIGKLKLNIANVEKLNISGISGNPTDQNKIIYE